MRLQALPQRTRDTLALASAVDGGEVPTLARAAPMLGLDLSDLIPAEAAGLITVHDSRVEFRHPLARSAIYGDAPADRRRELHRIWPAPCPTPKPTAAPGICAGLLRSRRRGLVGARAGRSARAPARCLPTSHPGRSSARPGWPPKRPGRVGYCMPRPTPPGSADLPIGPWRCLIRQGRHVPAADLTVAIDHLRGHIAVHRGPLTEGQEILLAAAERAAPTDPERAVVMLAEAAYASFFARRCPHHAPGRRTGRLTRPARPDRPSRVLHADRAGHGADLLG